MRRSMLTGGLLATLAMVLAGCSGTGNFDVQQTEPFRVQLEGEPRTVVVDEDDAEPQQVVIATCDDPCDGDRRPEEVTVKVQVTSKTVEEACIVKIIIKDRSTGEVLEEREVSTGGSGSGGSGSTSTVTQTRTQTATVTETQTGSSSGGITIENIVVNVKGKDNIVVLTQAIQGSADVDISAANARGNADADASVGDGSTTTASQTMTTTASGNSTASNTTTGSPP